MTARRRARVVLAGLLSGGLALAWLAGAPSPAGAQAREIHGEDSVFAGPGLALAWAVLRGGGEDGTQVVLRLAPAGGASTRVAVDAVDPFTRARHSVLEGRLLGGPVDVRSPRATFADFPRREIHLYQTEGDWQSRQPTVTIYFLGVPDTTPEFQTESALESYLASALRRLEGRGRRP